MSSLVTLTIQEDAAVIRIDNPPVNALSPGVPEGIVARIAEAESNPEVRVIVVMGAGNTFIAGADIRELENAAWGEPTNLAPLHDTLARIEACTKPVVMAIHGNALGGGLEVAMAGHYRVAVAGAQVGQPEVNLGIIPGAEGTQRLPRLVGIQKAIEMCVLGKPIKAPEALEAGVLDALIEGDLAEGAIEFARRIRSRPLLRTSDRAEKLGDVKSNAPLFAAGRELTRKTRRGQIAPLKAVDAIEAAVSLSFEQGCRRERELFDECLKGPQARALIHAFFAERSASKIPDVPKDAPIALPKTVAIIGAGTMGAGIAMACANAGLDVRMKDVSEQSLDAGMKNIRRNYESSVKKGRFTREAAEERIGRIRAQLDYSGFETADLIVEAAFENLELKKTIFAELDRIAKPECMLGTNTSTLDIDVIAAQTARPESVVGLHFFSPANVMRLLEIVRGKATSPEILASALALAKKLSKVGVVAGNCPGFIGNRMLFPYMYEAQFVAEEGASPEQVDRALTGFGMAMGIFAVDDMAGIDVACRVREELNQFSEPGARKPLVQPWLYAQSRYGQKTGKGWYTYGSDRQPAPDPEVNEMIRSLARQAGVAQRTFTDQEIIERTVYALINEGARLLDEGFALRASDIDVVYINGYGFPAWRGGPMFFADQTGLVNVLTTIQRFHADFGDRWKPAPLLERLAREGSTFREYDALRRI
jgi:3-hydroxyacyl-CoA dehydrogenase